MKSKKHKVEIPEGYEVESVQEYNPYDNKGNRWKETTVKFKPIKKRFRLKKWEEYTPKERKILMKSDMESIDEIRAGAIKKQLPKTWEEYNGNSILFPEWVPAFIPNKHAESFNALIKLIELRDHYNDGIERTVLYSIYKFHDRIASTDHYDQGPLVLNNTKLGREFRTNFRELIETAKPLL